MMQILCFEYIIHAFECASKSRGMFSIYNGPTDSYIAFIYERPGSAEPSILTQAIQTAFLLETLHSHPRKHKGLAGVVSLYLQGSPIPTSKSSQRLLRRASASD
jgi:hypothetical protein